MILGVDPLNRRHLGHLGGDQLVHHAPGSRDVVQLDPAAGGREPGVQRGCQFRVEPLRHIHSVPPSPGT